MADAGHLESVHLHGRTPLVRQWSGSRVLWALVAGALSALAAACVRLGFRGLQWIFTGSVADPPEAGAHLHLWRRFLTPVAGAVCATLVLWLRDRRATQAGEPVAPYVEYVAAVRHRHGEIPLRPNGWRTLSAAFSVASGAAVGREGSMIQFASAVTSLCCRRWRVPAGEDLSFFVACGVAGGFTAAYNAPLAATFAAAELVLGGVSWREMPLLAAAAGAGWGVSAAVLGPARLYPAPAALPWGPALWLLPLLALAAALLGPVYQWLLGCLRVARRLPLALVWGGLAVGALSVGDPRVWGNADAALRATLGIGLPPGTAVSQGGIARVLGYRLLATSACVWTGTVGGVFTPTVFAGGALGALGGQLLPMLHVPDADRLWAVAGMSFLLAAVTHAPLMAALMAVELTGNWHLLPVLLPLSWLASAIASRLSPQAMYAIASEAPSDAPSGAPGALAGRAGEGV